MEIKAETRESGGDGYFSFFSNEGYGCILDPRERVKNWRDVDGLLHVYTRRGSVLFSKNEAEIYLS